MVLPFSILTKMSDIPLGENKRISYPYSDPPSTIVAIRNATEDEDSVYR